MGKRHFLIDLAGDREEVLTRIMASDGRKTRWSGNGDETIKAAFASGYDYVTQSEEDGELSRGVIGRDEVKEIGNRWERRARRKWADAWAKNEKAIDPLTAWIIYQIIYFLIQLWWERRKQRLGS